MNPINTIARAELRARGVVDWRGLGLLVMTAVQPWKDKAVICSS
jgi:hypothetical protein